MKKLSYEEMEKRREKRTDKIEYVFTVLFEVVIGAIAFVAVVIGALMAFVFLCYHFGTTEVIATIFLVMAIFALRWYLDWRDRQKAKRGDYDPDDLDWDKINQDHYPSA